VKPVHLRAASAVWRYCQDSAAYLFADAPPAALDDRVMAALRKRGRWTSKTFLSQKVFKGEVKSYRLVAVLDKLVDSEVIERRKVETAGRPREEFRVL
jgi:uncharacterized protein (DUF2336 family)